MPKPQKGENILTSQPLTATIQAVGDMGQDEPLVKVKIPLNGKWSPSEDALMIGQDFYDMTNLRYTDTHVQGVQGMSKINTTALTSSIDNMFQFNKYQPEEHHLLAHAGGKVYVNDAVLPATGDFDATELWTDASGAGDGNFSDAPNGEIVYCNSKELCVWGGDKVSIGSFLTSEAEVTAGTLTNPKDYTEVVMDATATLASSANIATPSLYMLVGSRRPLKGVYFTILSGYENAAAATMACKEWNGSAWAAVVNGADGTADGGATLAKSGWFTFDSTVSTSKIRYLNGYILYWYQFIITGAATTAKISYVTCDAPFQALTDIWDGANREEFECYLRNASKTVSYATQVYEDDYSSADSGTYMSCGTWAFASDYIRVGFTEPCMGLEIGLAPDYVSATTSAMTVKYYNGSSFVTVGTITDMTSDGGKSFASSGVVTWQPLAEGLEFVSVENGIVPLYYYEISFSANLTANVRVNYISGLAAPRILPEYKFAAYAGNRVFLCNETEGRQNVARHSAAYTTQVFNGYDSMDIEFGGDAPLTAACSIFAQYGASLYNMNLFFKETETWSLVGSGPTDWVRYQMSNIEGCPAPKTLCTFHLPVETHTGLNRNVAMWQGNNGIYISDGRSPVPVHHDIRKYFDPNDSDCINSQYIQQSRGFIDRKNYEYHWIFYSGSGATLKELVFDYRRWKWYPMDRGTGNALLCGLPVTDTYAESYTYASNGGFVVRLNHGTQFVGVNTNSIAHTLSTGDIMFNDEDPFVDTLIRHIMLVGVTKATTTQTMTCTHYLDTSTSASATTYTMDPTKSGYRDYFEIKNCNIGPGLSHRFSFSITTSDENIGFEPLFIGIAHRPVRDRVKAT